MPYRKNRIIEKLKRDELVTSLKINYFYKTPSGSVPTGR